MKDEEKKAVAFVQYRSTASVIGTGWGFLMDNLWTLMRLLWPLILLYAVLGGALGALHFGALLHWAVLPAVGIVDVLASLAMFLAVAIVLHTYHRLGYFPAVQAIPLLRSEAKGGVQRLGRLLSLALRRPRHWGMLLAVLLAGVFLGGLLVFVGALPFCVATVVRYLAYVSNLMGDHATLPAAMPWMGMMAGLAFGFVAAVCDWIVLLPLAFAAGRLRKEEIEERNKTADYTD